MTGGVILNIVAGVVIFAAMSYYYGEKYTLNASVKDGIVPSELAKEMGFRKGDRLISVNGKPIVRFEEALSIDEILGDGATYVVERDGKQTEVKLPPDFIRRFSKNAKADFFTPRIHFVVGEVTPGYNADKAGLKTDDKIVQVDSTRFEYYDEFQALLKQHAGKETNLTVLRGPDTLHLRIPVDKAGHIGFRSEPTGLEYETVKYSLPASIPAGMHKAVETVDAQIKGWGKIFKGDIAVNKAVQGPIGIARFYGGEWIWSRFWLFTALISLGLAFMNILPIPALDGGHVLFLICEIVIGKPLSEKFLERAQYAGMVILLSLMALIFGNDLWQLFVH
jgi:regulator of sigma E protease